MTESMEDIKLPGVVVIEEFSDFEQPYYIRPCEYIRENGGEKEIIFSTRILYDMDCEDEKWLNLFNILLDIDKKVSMTKVDEESFQKAMDMLERCAFIEHPKDVPAEFGMTLCEDFLTQTTIMAIYLYWSQKRVRKGMALIPYFQPAPYERYQKQLKEWKERMELEQQESQRPATRQYKQEFEVGRPELFAKPDLLPFCVRLDRLETRKKMEKKQSERKRSVSSSSTTPCVSKPRTHIHKKRKKILRSDPKEKLGQKMEIFVGVEESNMKIIVATEGSRPNQSPCTQQGTMNERVPEMLASKLPTLAKDLEAIACTMRETAQAKREKAISLRAYANERHQILASAQSKASAALDAARALIDAQTNEDSEMEGDTETENNDDNNSDNDKDDNSDNNKDEPDDNHLPQGDDRPTSINSEIFGLWNPILNEASLRLDSTLKISKSMRKSDLNSKTE